MVLKLTIYDLHKLLISHLQVIVLTNARAVALKLPQKNTIYKSRFICRLFDRLRHKIACHYYDLASSSDNKTAKNCPNRFIYTYFNAKNLTELQLS